MKRGRPREVVDPVRVSVRISAAVYDRLDRVARQRDASVPEVIRRVISASINPTPRSSSAQ